MSEPEFRSQAAGTTNANKRRDWFKSRAREASKQGARWHRFNYDKLTGALLYEGWKTPPGSGSGPHVNGPGGAI